MVCVRDRLKQQQRIKMKKKLFTADMFEGVLTVEMSRPRTFIKGEEDESMFDIEISPVDNPVEIESLILNARQVDMLIRMLTIARAECFENVGHIKQEVIRI